MRNMLWWREEFRDISTRFYYIIRVYTSLLAEKFVKQGVLQNVDEIWHIDFNDIQKYIDKKITKQQLQTILEKNIDYYLSFRNYISDNEIGREIKPMKRSGSLTGICANPGVVTAKARVIDSFDEIDKIQPNEILVTKYTDTGWTPKFAILSGLVTECGGALCHAAIVAREYNIPSIVACKNATQKIKDGQLITLDAVNGVIILEEKRRFFAVSQ